MQRYKKDEITFAIPRLFFVFLQLDLNSEENEETNKIYFFDVHDAVGHEGHSIKSC